jgi:hypothetical protein
MQKTDKWSEQTAFYRFPNNKNVTEQALIQCAIDRCVNACKGLKEALIIQDTTELNLETRLKRMQDRKGLGEVGNGTDPGFFVTRVSL